MDRVDPRVYAAVRQHLTRTVDPQAWPWVGAETVHQQLDAWLADQDRRCRDETWAAGFREHCPVPGMVDADYAQRWVPVEEGWALVGIRMRGQDTSKPFVDVVATTGPLPWRATLEAGLGAYAGFRPTRARIRASVEPSAPEVGVSVDQHYLAAPLYEMRTEPSDISLAPLREVERGYAYVCDAFRAWEATRPWLSAHVDPISKADLADAMGRGTAHWIKRDGGCVGLLVTLPHADREWSGHAVWEEVVHPDHAGAGVAARAQRALAQQLDGVLFGTIDARNEPSRRAAQAAGRDVVGAYWWLDPLRPTPKGAS